MFNIYRKELDFGGKKLVLETGKLARQADGSCFVKWGDTEILATAVAAKKASADATFFPLTVVYREMTSAAGKIPGGFFKREGKPSEKEVLTSRLIDRPLRPLFEQYYYNEVQVVCTLLSYGPDDEPDVIALIAASLAVKLAGLPITATLGGCRVGKIDGKFVLNPSFKDLDKSDLDLIVGATSDSIMMVESDANELTEHELLEALRFAHDAIKPVIVAIDQLTDLAGKSKKISVQAPESVKEMEDYFRKHASEKLKQAYLEPQKLKRYEAVDAIFAETSKNFEEKYSPVLIGECFKAIESEVVRHKILEQAVRIDGRSSTSIRPIECETSILCRTHGSALFTRGETQSLGMVTLGTKDDAQTIDALSGLTESKFMLHYNFLPYSVNEVGRMSGPGRREIGHGELAKRSVKRMIPTFEEFPYVIRCISEITESNGSSSMATVCSSILAMMDAGVPVKKPVAGIAMGLIKEGDKFTVLSDIMGDEDHLGDMDFKVAGTASGVTALQMDIKISGVTIEIMEKALNQAKDGRLHILSKMQDAVNASSNGGLSKFAPRIESITINKDKIREIIGPGGKVIKDICEKTGVKIDIEDSGLVKIASSSPEGIENAIKMIKNIVAEPEIGTIFTGTVSDMMDFGYFVDLTGKTSGMISRRGLNPKIKLSKGQTVQVQVNSFVKGKINLTLLEEEKYYTESDGDSQQVQADKPERPKQHHSRAPKSHEPKPFSQPKEEQPRVSGESSRENLREHREKVKQKMVEKRKFF